MSDNPPVLGKEADKKKDVEEELPTTTPSGSGGDEETPKKNIPIEKTCGGGSLPDTREGKENKGREEKEKEHEGDKSKGKEVVEEQEKIDGAVDTSLSEGPISEEATFYLILRKPASCVFPYILQGDIQLGSIQISNTKKEPLSSRTEQYFISKLTGRAGIVGRWINLQLVVCRKYKLITV
ncbi:hypothetical protein SUGI_0997040 [Cryptomeria japonica]|nr:hypothetical protein SUGI_0997040 [Cryptomeria japonica]